MSFAFLSISVSHRSDFNAEIQSIKNACASQGVDLYVFVDQYVLEPGGEIKMMSAAFSQIRNSLFVISEVSNKAIGVGIEIGYAAALGIPIVYLRNANSEHSLTVAGVASKSVVYTNATNLEIRLSETLLNLHSK
ncbi:MAG: hypothetical protein EOP04_15030 [Proteobacteria bacterium]|nr:MAG: hypothetical protein EOP04_15030 [Pseudomonadota bacterium]